MICITLWDGPEGKGHHRWSAATELVVRLCNLFLISLLPFTANVFSPLIYFSPCFCPMAIVRHLDLAAWPLNYVFIIIIQAQFRPDNSHFQVIFLLVTPLRLSSCPKAYIIQMRLVYPFFFSFLQENTWQQQLQEERVCFGWQSRLEPILVIPSWRQQLEAAWCPASTIGKQRGMDSHAQLSSSFLWNLGSWPMEGAVYIFSGFSNFS